MPDGVDRERLLFALQQNLRRAFLGLMEQARGELEAGGLRAPQAMVLKALDDAGPLRHGELAEVLGITPGSLTPVVAGLEQRGLVRRSRDPSDRRAVLLELGPQAERHRDAFEARMQGRIGAAFDDWDTDDLEALSWLLAKMSTDLAGLRNAPAEAVSGRRAAGPKKG